LRDDDLNIFISHTQGDQDLAHAFRDAVRSLLGERVVVSYSTNKEIEGGIKPGEDWFRWIGEKVRGSRIALILLTPTSVQKPWVLWEGGAVAGVALSGEGATERKLRPITFNLKNEEIPGPFSRQQITDGLDEADVLRLLEDLLSLFETRPEHLIRAAKRLEPAKQQYLAAAREALRMAPMIATEAAVQEWIERIDALDQSAKYSEAEELQDWMDVAFGRGRSGLTRPLDLRIHRRLGELYAKAGNPARAVGEFELARQLAPRDIYVLRRLGKAHLDCGSMDEAGRILAAIGRLDPQAFVRNVENVALQARWHREQGDHAGAGAALRKALDANPRSYYLADLLGQAELALGDHVGARATYERALAAIDQLADCNVWTIATALTASIVVDDADRQQRFVSLLAAARITPGDARSILGGIDRVAAQITVSPELMEQIVRALNTGQGET
jgi:tetratricopeptide (TPR) repeat protein